MNVPTPTIVHSDKESDQYFRETLLYLPQDLNDVSDTRNCPVQSFDGKEFERINPSSANGTKNNDVKKSRSSLLLTLTLPMSTSDDESLNDSKIFCSDDQTDWHVDELIAKGNFPVLFSANEALRKQTPIVLLSEEDIEKTPNGFAESTVATSNNMDVSILSQSRRVLYVAQGEIAHCTAVQSDLLVSDRATTCHIIALRSSCVYPPKKNTASSELCTIAHLDSCSYSGCIVDAFQSHYSFHCSRCDFVIDSETVEPCIDLDIHIVGGFNDTSGASRSMTKWIMNLMANLADKYNASKPSMMMTLRNACVTSANHDAETGGPVVRGLALDCHSGKVFVAHTMYPCPVIQLRKAKIWLRGHSSTICDEISLSKLDIVHSQRDDTVVINPLFTNGIRSCYCGFVQLQMQRQLQQLSQIRNDKILLEYCSTSPEHEEEDFCETTRCSLQYILKQFDSNKNDILDAELSSTTTPSIFRRVGTNTWWQVE